MHKGKRQKTKAKSKRQKARGKRQRQKAKDKRREAKDKGKKKKTKGERQETKAKGKRQKAKNQKQTAKDKGKRLQGRFFFSRRRITMCCACAPRRSPPSLTAQLSSLLALEENRVGGRQVSLRTPRKPHCARIRAAAETSAAPRPMIDQLCLLVTVTTGVPLVAPPLLPRLPLVVPAFPDRVLATPPPPLAPPLARCL